MVSGIASSLNPWQRRSRRAKFLAQSYPACREVLTFYSELAEWQGSVAPHLTGFNKIEAVLPSFFDLVRQTGSPPLRSRADALMQESRQFLDFVRRYWESPGDPSPDDCFARIVLQVIAANLPDGLDCPWCARPRLVGCLKEQADGKALELLCALCLRPRAFPRGQCAACGESADGKLSAVSADAYPHIRLQACESCRAYIHVVDIARDPAAVPEVDELAALPLDLWAVEHDYHKLQPNIAGV